jgi:16S rRNA (adenine1518-N6/adenine1519-N6)-dimethyltransferase
MTLSEMRQLLDERGIQLTKSLGQNFLHDSNQLRRIVATAELKPTDRVLEIGPGLGPLTELLLAEAGEVFAVEKDARLVTVLQERFAGQTKLRLLHGDGLEVVRAKSSDWAGWKLVANLPYSVASPILVELASNAHPPDRMTATLQLEVARRLKAVAGGDDYGLLSLLVQLRYEPRGLFRIPSGCFFPSPDVDSACITLVKREHALLPETLRPVFVRLVKLAFSQRRKMMLKLLKQEWPAPALESAVAQLGLSPQVRAEAVTLDQFVALTKLLNPTDASA